MIFELANVFKKIIGLDNNVEFCWIEQVFLELIYSKNIYEDLPKLESLNKNIHLGNSTNLAQLIQYIELNLFVHKIFSNLFNLLDLIEYLITFDIQSKFINIFNINLKQKIIDLANNYENSNMEHKNIIKLKIKNIIWLCEKSFRSANNFELIDYFDDKQNYLINQTNPINSIKLANIEMANCILHPKKKILNKIKPINNINKLINTNTDLNANTNTIILDDFIN